MSLVDYSGNPRPVLYSTGCPRCRILKAKLEEVKFEYELKTDCSKLMEMGITTVPVLALPDGRVFDFDKAMKFLITERGK